VSSSSPGATWQGEGLAAAFLEQRQTLVPLVEIQEDLIRRLFERRQRTVGRFLDVGSGDGAMSELVLSAYPGAEAVLVDFSSPMLDRVGERLERFANRWRIVRGDLSHPAWVDGLPAGRDGLPAGRDGLPAGGYDTAISALAIHHLPAERKRHLFAELYGLLEPGGMFVNMDFVLVNGPLRGLFDEQMLTNLVKAERERGSTRSAEEIERELATDGDEDEDRPDTVEDQLRWLTEAGFEQAEVHFKWADAAVLGAIKPDGG
jgi:tRNA (cmo5U34)-methyltransferase